MCVCVCVCVCLCVCVQLTRLQQCVRLFPVFGCVVSLCEHIES